MARLGRVLGALGVGAVLAAVIGLIAPAAALAHPTGTTLLTISRADGGVALDVQIPLDRLEQALGIEMTDEPAAAIDANQVSLRSILATKVDVLSASGASWRVTVDTVELGSIERVDQLHARLRATPPADVSTAIFTLDYRVVVDTIASHTVYVAAARGGDDSVELIGTISQRHPSLVVELDNPHGVDLGSIIKLGIDHFRSGTDHLLFLTLVAAGAAFEKCRTRRRVAHLAVRTAAFTVGHSASLALATAGALTLPSRLVETAIAVTILLSAVHLAQPIIPRRAEPAITLVFGFIHGFGFAATLANLGLTGAALVAPTFGFNIGLEIAQLAAALAVAPSLWWLARRRRARLSIALFGAVVAVGWIAERTLAVPNPTAPLVDAIAAAPERLALVLVIAAALAAITVRLRSARPPCRRPLEIDATQSIAHP